MVAAIALLAAATMAPAKDWVMLLPIAVPVTIPQEKRSLESLLARAAMLDPFLDRGIDILSPAMTMVSKDESGLDLDDPKFWTHDNFVTLAKRWKVRYVASVEITSFEFAESPIPPKNNQASPGNQLDATVKLTVNLFDNKMGKYIFENKTLAETASSPLPHADDEKEKAQRSAMMKATSRCMAPYLEKLPKVKRKAAPRKDGKDDALPPLR
jgi:hypothetical protein